MSESSGDLSLGYMMGQSEGNSNNGGFGSFGEGIWAVIILAILFGNGGLGNGFGGNGGGNMSAGFAWQGIDGGIRGVQQGICDATFSLNNTIVNGFRGVDNAICTLGYQNQQCCCETQRLLERGFCDTQRAISDSTRDIIENQNCNYRGLMDFMVQSKIDKLQSENEALRLSASQAKQNQYLIDALRPSPIPAYITCNPFTASWGAGYGYGRDGGCGCGCGC